MKVTQTIFAFQKLLLVLVIFVGHVAAHPLVKDGETDTQHLVRQKREIIFRPLFVYRMEELDKKRYEEKHPQEFVHQSQYAPYYAYNPYY